MRRRSHAEAQAEPFRAVEIPPHPQVSSSEPELIDGDGPLQELLSHVRDIGRFCYDTEFIGESFYHPHLCLVQIATPERVAVVDALAKVDLTPIWRLVADPDILTIVHAGQQDLEPVVRHLRRPPANVFDTQIAGGFAGLPYPLSLTRLTKELLGIRLGKSLTFTSWDQRPLSHAHRHYAADDVRFGLALHDELRRRLDTNGNAALALNQCEKLCDPRLYQPDLIETASKVRGGKSLKRPQAAALYELVLVRDELARLHDLPPRSTIRDEVLVDIARRNPGSVTELEGIRGLPRPIRADHGDRLVDALRRGAERRKPPWPTTREHEESPGEQFNIDALWALTQAHCRSQSIDPALLGNRGAFADFCRRLIGNDDATFAAPGDWRHGLIVEVIVPVVRGERALTFAWSEDRLTEQSIEGPAGQTPVDRR